MSHIIREDLEDPDRLANLYVQAVQAQLVAKQ